MNISTTSEQFGHDAVSVTLQWIPASFNSLYSYNVIVDPQVQLQFNGSTRVQLTLSYNTLYNVSVVATHLCGQNTNNMITFVELYYICKLPHNP